MFLDGIRTRALIEVPKRPSLPLDGFDAQNRRFENKRQKKRIKKRGRNLKHSPKKRVLTRPGKGTALYKKPLKPRKRSKQLSISFR